MHVSILYCTYWLGLPQVVPHNLDLPMSGKAPNPVLFWILFLLVFPFLGLALRHVELATVINL